MCQGDGRDGRPRAGRSNRHDSVTMIGIRRGAGAGVVTSRSALCPQTRRTLDQHEVSTLSNQHGLAKTLELCGALLLWCI